MASSTSGTEAGAGGGGGAGAGAGGAPAPAFKPAGAHDYPRTEKGLSIQNRDIDVSTLHPLTPEVISRQATINIGTIGHVAHGKSTTVKSISGVHTVKYKSEKERNITIKLGYANAKVYRASAPPYSFTTAGSSSPDEFPMNDGTDRTYQVVRHVSFVDCPGHDVLMATMLNGAAVMDAALLLIAANEHCPQPQTSEHLAAVEIMQLQNIIILQNKIDLVKEEQAKEQYEAIKTFVAGTVAGDAPIVPISAVRRYNIDLVAQYVACHFPVPTRNFTVTPRLIVVRSFDVNKPGSAIEDLKGGVAGGSIVQGVLKVGDEIEIRPGIVSEARYGSQRCTPIYSRIHSLFAEQNDLEYAVPGGLIGVGTHIDPTLTRADRLVGQVLGHPGRLPEVYITIRVKYHLLRRLLGVKADGDKAARVSRMRKGETLMVNIGSTSTSAKVLSAEGHAVMELQQPVCTEVGDDVQAKIAISRRVDNHWRLIGWGSIVDGETATITPRRK